MFGILQHISIEIGEDCNLKQYHNKCPSTIRKIDKSRGLLKDHDIIFIIEDAYTNGFHGKIAFHYYNEPLLYLDRMLKIINQCQFAKFTLWTNGTLFNPDPNANDFLNKFDYVCISNYGGVERYEFYLKLKEIYHNTEIEINDYTSETLDNRKYIYSNEESNKDGCSRPFNIEIPIDCYGNVHLCCRDWNNSCKIGNVLESPLSVIISSDGFLKLKESLYKPFLDRNSCPEVCRKCDQPCIPKELYKLYNIPE